MLIQCTIETNQNGGITLPKLFVYGTIREGERNHFYLQDSPCIFKQCWISGSLYDTGNGYPALLENNTSHVYGELYDVTLKQLKEIDQLEEYVENDPNNLYDRKYITVANDKGEQVEALTYFAGKSLIKSDERIELGDWNVHTHLKNTDAILYFAYGSCMDDERFKIQGVDQHFKHVAGSGLLSGFELQFSRNSSDGGKADIVENPSEKIEGKVYQLSKDAITYLYKREGVYQDAYRPIIITILLNGQNKIALTFYGTKKEVETAPTINYATEIIRGSTGFLSNRYVEKLQSKINLLLER